MAALAATAVYAFSMLPGLWQASRILEVPLPSSVGKLLRPGLLWVALTIVGLAAKSALVSAAVPAWLAAFACSGLAAAAFAVLLGLKPKLFLASAPSDLITTYRRRAFASARSRFRGG
jgi:threonine/homoserine efflux transporter RhtA